MKTNHEAIYGTRASIFSELPDWGRITVKNGEKPALFAMLYKTPENGELYFPGLLGADLSQKASVLGETAQLEMSMNKGALIVKVPHQFKNKEHFVIKIPLTQNASVDPAIHAKADGSLVLTPSQASINGSLKVNNPNISGFNQATESHLETWTDAKSTASWDITLNQAKSYHIKINFAAEDSSVGSVIELVNGEQILATATIKSTSSWKKFETMEIGTIPLAAGRSRLTFRCKVKNGIAPCNLGKITLTP